jgi:hypothetical protein
MDSIVLYEDKNNKKTPVGRPAAKISIISKGVYYDQLD